MSTKQFQNFHHTTARGLAITAFLANQAARFAHITIDRSPTDIFYYLMSKDILKERKRVGENWIVAFAVTKRADRDVIRKVLGDDLIFVVLDISLDLVVERLKGRGQGEEAIATAHKHYEPAQKDEPNTLSFEIKRGVSREQNAQEVFDLINKKMN